MDEGTVKVLSANQKLIGRVRVPVGFEHNIDPGSPEYERTKEPRDIAGQGNVICLSGEGIYLDDSTWTPLGNEKATHYEDLSPTPIFDKKTRRVVGLLSASFTRTGSIFDLTLASAANAIATLSASSEIVIPEEPMNQPKFLSVVALAAALKLPADASDETICAAIAKLGVPAAASTIKVKFGDKEMEFTIEQLAARVVTLESKFEEGETLSVGRERAALMARLASEGKAPLDPDTGKPFSADALGKLELSSLKILCVNTPATVPLSSRNRAVNEGSQLDPNLKGTSRVIAAFEREQQMTGAQ